MFCCFCFLFCLESLYYIFLGFASFLVVVIVVVVFFLGGGSFVLIFCYFIFGCLSKNLTKICK